MTTYELQQQPQTLQRIYNALDDKQREEIKQLLAKNRKLKTYAKPQNRDNK